MLKLITYYVLYPLLYIVIMNSELIDKEKPEDVPVLDESKINKIDGDDVLKFLGRCGRYQKWQTFLIFLTSTNIAFPILNGLFVGKYV